MNLLLTAILTLTLGVKGVPFTPMEVERLRLKDGHVVS